MIAKYDALTIPEEDLEFQLETILSFLSITHPYLNDPEYRETCVEIRPVLREGKNYVLSKSLILWNLEELSVLRLKEFLKKHNGVPTCLFYSVYSFDNHKNVLTKKGYKKGTIHTDNAVFTCEIVLDFDNTSQKEQAYYNEVLGEAGIYPFWIFSGHGYQAHILLDEKLYETDALKKFVALFQSKGFPVDGACTDPARLMRIPFTYNCKAFSQTQHPERECPVICEIHQYSDYRHSIPELEYKISGLPLVYPPEEKIYQDLKDNKTKKGSISTSPQFQAVVSDIELKKIEYPYIQNYNIQEPIYKMLSFTPEGYRNDALGFLIQHFKMRLKMPMQQIYEILSLWRKKACSPPISDYEFEADFKRLYHVYNGLNYNSSLAEKFGYIDFEQSIVLSKKEVSISNHFFKDFPNLDGKLIRMYIAIRLLEHMSQETTQETIAKLLGISVRAVRTTLKELLQTPHCYVVKGNAKKKIPNSYHCHRLYETTAGYSVFTYNDLKCYIKELFEDKKRGNNELKLYLYMQYRFRNQEIFMSQTTFGRELGLEQNSISEIVSRLIEKNFLHVEKRPHETQKHFEKCHYTLLR